MPRFFFDTNDGASFLRDDDGHLVADLETAQNMALMGLPDMARDSLAHGGDQHSFSVDIRDEAGQVVYTAHMSVSAQRFG